MAPAADDNFRRLSGGNYVLAQNTQPSRPFFHFRKPGIFCSAFGAGAPLANFLLFGRPRHPVFFRGRAAVL
jgi:hypothetical protein